MAALKLWLRKALKMHLLALAAFTVLSSHVLADFNLTILHTNDVHARIEQTNKYGGKCSDLDAAINKCFGGVARRKTAIDQIRKTDENVLLLDGGDQFQGTLWFNVYKGLEASTFMNDLGYDAMAFGNHEFDNRISGLLPFVKAANFSLVCANMDVSQEPLWPQRDTIYKKSNVFTLSGIKVGVIGYIIKETTWLSSPGRKIKFLDEVEAVKTEAARLKSQGVKIIIAVGHAGIDVDINIAKNVEDVDVVVGGHTNTFMYTGTPPSNEKPYGNYPLIVNPTSKPAKKIPVVQDFTFGKYLGNLKLRFDDNGELISYNGNPILLDGSYAQNPALLKKVEGMAGAVRNFSEVSLGKTHVFLDGERTSCRLKECNLANFVLDALVHTNAKQPDELKWADVGIALWNGGGIRTSIDKKPNETITYGTLLSVLPFGNTADIVEIKGEHILQALEFGVTKWNPSSPSGKFLQVSGIRVTYDMSKPEGSRVAGCRVRCAQCRVPKYEPINKTTVYKVILSSFIADGGDNYQVFVNHTMKRHPGNVASTMVADYIKTESPVIIGEEDRIMFASPSPPPSPQPSASPSPQPSASPSPQPSSASTNTAATMTAFAVVVFFIPMLL
ncbi:snake venom 5'-nucleotidase-like isoform X2 [Rhopilema esculentum]|uniref:snake venom 5'-nucleotidase-like isoform X2 n=1 Tax=Rhopilema esculentum TaxID=499914 RepID=UPI0031D6035D